MTKTPEKPGCANHSCEACKRTRRDAPITMQTRIDQLVEQHGSLRATSRVIGLDVGYLARLRSGKKKNPTSSTLHRLGLQRVITYHAAKRIAAR